MYQNNHKKFVAVCNKKISTAQLMNAMGHCTVGLASQIPADDIKLLDYLSKEGESHGNISTFPYIVLKADNSNKIYNLSNQLREKKIPFCCFTETMLGYSAQEQLDATKSYSFQDANYFCLVAFADADVLQPLTKKFSLMK